MSIYRGSDLIIPRWKGNIVDKVYHGSDLIYTKGTPTTTILYPDANSTPSDFDNGSAEPTKWEGIVIELDSGDNVGTGTAMSTLWDDVELYTLDDLGAKSNITNVRVEFEYELTQESTVLDAYVAAALKIDGTEHFGDTDNITSLDTPQGPFSYSYDWTENPETETTWTDDDIDDLIAGITCYGTMSGYGIGFFFGEFKVTVSHDE